MKALKKSVETEINQIIKQALSSRNKKVSEEMAKFIREASKDVAKKFVKKLSRQELKTDSTSGTKKIGNSKAKVESVMSGKKIIKRKSTSKSGKSPVKKSNQ